MFLVSRRLSLRVSVGVESVNPLDDAKGYWMDFCDESNGVGRSIMSGKVGLARWKRLRSLVGKLQCGVLAVRSCFGPRV